MLPVDLFKALADPTRLRSLLLILQEDELCVCELTAALNEIQPKISRHLAQLRQCGLLLDRRAGQWVFYRLNPDCPPWIRAVLDTTLAANGEVIRDDRARLDAMGERPARVQACC